MKICTFIIVSIWIRLRNVSRKICRKSQNAHFIFSSSFFFPKIMPFTICKNHKLQCCVFTVTMVTRTRHSVTLCVRCLPCYFLGPEMFLIAPLRPYRSASCPFYLVPNHAYFSRRTIASAGTFRNSRWVQQHTRGDTLYYTTSIHRSVRLFLKVVVATHV